DHVNDRLDQRDGTRPRTASVHSIHAFGRMGDQRARPTLARRILRTVGSFMIAVLIGVGGTLAWQSYGDVAKEMVAGRAPTRGWLLSYLPTKSPIAAASANPAASSLDALRRSVEQLAVRQDQMAQYMMTLRVIEEDIRQKMSFSPPSVPTALTQPPAPVVQQKPAARAPVPLAR